MHDVCACLQVAEALQLSRSTFAKIQQNLWWAFGYNLVGIPLAAGALLPAYGIALTPSVSGGHNLSICASVCLQGMTQHMHNSPL